MGFANFYRRFIKDYSKVAAPLTQLTSNLKTFTWTPEADSAFGELKALFFFSSCFMSPRPFIVEINASDLGVGAVLSQRSEKDSKTHPCAFFSRRLSSADQNYDVGNRELLVIKLALEELRHWLEGTETPFVIWIDHKNLTYLQNAKRLKPQQSRWSLFFTCFNFSTTYRPGSRNVKANALSRQFSSTESSNPKDCIVPGTCFVGTLTWDIENTIDVAQQSEPNPGQGKSLYLELSSAKCWIGSTTTVLPVISALLAC